MCGELALICTLAGFLLFALADVLFPAEVLAAGGKPLPLTCRTDRGWRGAAVGNLADLDCFDDAVPAGVLPAGVLPAGGFLPNTLGLVLMTSGVAVAAACCEAAILAAALALVIRTPGN